MNFASYIKSLLLTLLLLYIALLLYFRVGIAKIAAITAFLATLYFLMRPHQLAPRHQKIAYIAAIWLLPMTGVPMGLGLALTPSPFAAFLWGYLLIVLLGYLDAPIPLIVLQIIATIITIAKTPRPFPTSIWTAALTNLLMAYDVWPQFVKQGVGISWYVYFAYEGVQPTHLAYQLFLRYYALEVSRLDAAMWAYQLSLLIPIALYEVFEKSTKKAEWATAIFTFTYATFSLPIALASALSTGTEGAVVIARDFQVMAQYAWFYVYAVTVAQLATVRLINLNEPASVLSAISSHVIALAYLPIAMVVRVLLGGPSLDKKTALSTIATIPFTYIMTQSITLTIVSSFIFILYMVIYLLYEKMGVLLKIIKTLPDMRIFIIVIMAMVTAAYIISPLQYVNFYYSTYQAGEYPPLISFIIPTGHVGLLAVLRSLKREQVAILLIVIGSYVLFLSGSLIGVAAGGLRLAPYLMYISALIAARDYNTAVLAPVLLLSFGNAVIYADGWYVGGFNIPTISPLCHHICVTDSWVGRSQLLISNGVPVKNINLFTAQYPLGPLWVLKTYGNGTLQTFPFGKGDGYLYSTPPENLSATPPPAISATTAVLGDEVNLIRRLYNAGLPVAVVAPADLYAHAGTIIIGNSTIEIKRTCPTQAELPHSLWTYINITLTGVGEIRMWEGAIQVGDEVVFGEYSTRRANTTQIIYANSTWLVNGHPLEVKDRPYYFFISCKNGTLNVRAARVLPEPGSGEVRYFPLVKPPRLKIYSTFEDYRQPKVVDAFEAEGARVVAPSGVLEEADGVTLVEPLSNVSIIAEKLYIHGGGFTYPRVRIENGVINNRHVKWAYLLLRYPNITASKAALVTEGVKYSGDNVKCEYAVWDGSLYCFNLYYYKDGKAVLKTSPVAANPPAEELSLLAKAAPLLVFAVPAAFVLVLLNDIFTKRLEESQEVA